MKNRIGVAISVYDKGNFVKTNINIIKNLWKIEPYISICCNHQETFEKLQKIDGVNVVRGDDLPFDHKLQLRLRQHDCIKKSVLQACQNSEYVIHWHGDAFALSEKSIVEIVDHMDSNNIWFAGRGFWKEFKSPKVPVGDIDDHFFIMRSELVTQSGIFDDNLLEDVEKLALMGICSEGILAILVQKAIDDEDIYIYSDMSECFVLPSSRTDDRYSDNIAHRTLPPVNFDRGRKFLHCDDIACLRQIFDEEGIDQSYICETL